MVTENYYWEVLIDCPTSIVELLQSSLFEIAAEGIEELDSSNKNTRIKVFFSNQKEDPLIKIQPILKHFDEFPPHIISSEKKALENWQENWKEHFKPIEIGQNLLIRPPWEASNTEKKEIVIEPGFGFGTGYHESTSLALKALEETMEREKIHSVIDVGAGSGILTIAALLLGASRANALEIDLESLQEIHKNMLHSGLDPKQCKLFHGSPENIQIQGDLVIANIIAEVLLKLKESLNALIAPGGILILSGIISEFEKEVLSSFQKTLTLLATYRKKEWFCFVFQRNSK